MMRSEFSENIESQRFEPSRQHLNDVVTEDSAAQMFVERYAEKIRYCHSTGAWFNWTGVRWQRDLTGWAYQQARKLARDLGEDQDERGRKAIGKTSFASGVERFSRGDEVIAVTIDYWDPDPWLLGTPAGAVDLQTGQHRDPIRSNGITKSAGCVPLDCGCPRWLQFLAETTGDDAGLIRFLQQWCGYCLTGITREHALVFVYGPGGNGKSVFLDVVTTVMGDYATTAPMDTLTAAFGERHPTDLAMLRGARLVTASETEQGRAWAEARIKQMTGGDPIAARFMRQDFFNFRPAFKLFIVGNHKPVLRNVDEAARRRFNIVPFVAKPATPDRELKQKLIEEGGAILQWMIEGCIDWQRNGLIRPDSVVVPTDAYFSDQDLLGQWLEDCCDVQSGNPRIWDRSSDLFDSWTEYAHKAGDEPGTRKAFGQSMQRRGLEPYRVPNQGTRAFRFVRLKSHEVTRDA
jgi:putative DNA primase/helicase